MSESTPNLLPHDHEAEMVLLASVLADNASILDIAAVVSDQTFHSGAHRQLWAAICDLYLNRNVVADPVTVFDELSRRQQIADIGGPSYLVDLVRGYSNPHAVTRYAEILRGYEVRRDLILASGEIRQLADDRALDPLAAAERAEQSLFAILNHQHRSQAQHIGTAARDAMDRIAKRVDKTVSDDGVAIGWPDVDRVLGAMENGALVVIAARPGVGKSAVAVNIAYKVAERGLQVMLCSLEMSRLELSERFLSLATGIDGLKLKRGSLNPYEMDRLVDAAGRFQTFPWMIDDAPHQTALTITAAARRAKAKHDLRLMIIDYLQLVTPDDESIQRHEQVAKLSRRLKLMAREVGIPVVVLAQVNRKSEDRAGGRIKMSDLRESGAVEQDADSVILIQAPSYDQQHSDCVEVELEVAKNRNGMTGAISMMYSRNISRFDQKATI